MAYRLLLSLFMENKKSYSHFALAAAVFLMTVVMPKLSFADSCLEFYSRKPIFKPLLLTKGEVVSSVFLTAGHGENGKSEAQIEQDSGNAVRVLRNHKIYSFPRRESWGFEEVLVSEQSSSRVEQEKASDRLNGLERTFNKTLVPEREALEYAADGITLVGVEAISKFLNTVTENGEKALETRKEFLKGATINLYDRALNAFVAAPMVALPFKNIDSFNAVFGEYGTAAAVTTMAIGGIHYLASMNGFLPIRPIVKYKVKKAERFGKVYSAILENIRDAIDQNATEKWIYWGVNAEIPQDYLMSFVDPKFLPQANWKNAELTFPYTQIQKKQMLEGTADLALDLLFKFEDQSDGTRLPTLTVFTRYAVPKDPPPPRMPKKKPEHKLAPKAQWLPGLSPAGIPIR